MTSFVHHFEAMLVRVAPLIYSLLAFQSKGLTGNYLIVAIRTWVRSVQPWRTLAIPSCMSVVIPCVSAVC